VSGLAERLVLLQDDRSMPTQSTALSAPLSAVLVLVLALSVWYDVREKRIPNWITASGLMVALVSRAFVGLDALSAGLMGSGLGLALGIAFFAVGAMGAGDGKLLTTVGALLGFDTFLWCLPLVGAFGGLLALVVTVRNGTVVPTLVRFRDLMFHFVSFGRIGDRNTLSAPGAVAVPYGVAVAAGAVTAWLGWGLAL
jgi:prepilin peptidase CpaA